MTDEQTRIRGYLQTQGAKQTPAEIVAKVEAAMADLAKAARAVPAARFAERPEPEEWSANEVLAHVVAADTYFGGGIVAILEGRAAPPRGGGRGFENAPLRTVDAWLEILRGQRQPLFDRARRGSGRPARCDDRASVLRPAQLARDAAVHAPARSRSRGSARQDRRGVRRDPAARRVTAMNVAISLRLATEDWEQGSAYVVEAERLGAESVWTPEAWGHDAVAPLAFLAARTSRIGLGTGIMQAGTRTPALIAMTALSLASMSNGRFRLGLGVSGPQVIEGWHGVRFDRPVRRLRETVEIVRRAAAGERLSYKGEVYELPLPGGEGKALRVAAKPRAGIPIYLATMSAPSLGVPGG